jgi:hypothetical protein
MRADVQVGKVAHRQRARDRRRAHHQQVRLEARWLVAAAQLAPQLEPLRDAEAVLLVDHRQPQALEAHVVLDHRVRAHHQRRLAAGHALDHRAPALALARSGQPGHADPQRLEPLHQLAKVLLGQDLGGRHQRALPAGVDGARGRQRRHHRLAGADIALQQPVHRVRARQVGVDLGADAALRRGEREGQRGQQLRMQAVGARGQHRRAQQRALALRRQLRQLLGQQLVELQPLPSRVAAVLQRRQVGVGRRVVQELQRLAQRGQRRRHGARRQQLGQRRARQRRGHHLAQVGLRQLRAARVDGRQRARQRRVLVHRPDLRVHHLAAEEADAQLAAHAQPAPGCERLQLRRVVVQEAQHQDVAAALGVRVAQPHDELAARALLDAVVEHHAFHLHRVAVARLRHGHQPRLVLVAQRQVQREVDVAHQTQPRQRARRGRQRLGGVCGHGGCGNVGHGTILRPAHSVQAGPA